MYALISKLTARDKQARKGDKLLTLLYEALIKDTAAERLGISFVMTPDRRIELKKRAAVLGYWWSRESGALCLTDYGEDRPKIVTADVQFAVKATTELLARAV